ncbi:MAG TPA: cytochrome c [Candidatus Acidoferrales bacterium]|nr:cytochrome c [Candidatus Acidoferrales bacterium]
MKFILGVVIGLILVPLLVVGYLASGFAPTAATDKPLPFETWIAGTALRERIQKEAPVRDLSTMTTADLVAGADTYKKDCAVCHGMPDHDSEIGAGMFPPAPQLLQPPKPRPEFQPGRGREGERGPGRPGGPGRSGPRPNGDFWRVKNGIRLTGMPSFEKTLSDDQMWQIIALLQRRRNWPPEVKAAIQPEVAAAAVPALPAPTRAVPAKPQPKSETTKQH